MPTEIVIAPPAPATGSAVRLLLQVWLSQFSPLTRQAYTQAVQDFQRFVKSESPEDAIGRLFACDKRAAATVLSAWRVDLRETRGRAAATCNARLAAMRGLLNHAKEMDLIPWSVRLRDFPSQTYRNTAGPGVENLRRMMAKARRIPDRALSARTLAILRLAFDLGLRGSEIVGLNLSDVDLPAGKILVLGKKRSERAGMTLPDPTAQALERWIVYRGEKPGPLLLVIGNNKRGQRITRQTVFRTVRELGESIGVKTSPHGLRHTAVTCAAERLSLLDAQRFARHSDPRITLKYVDSIDDKAGKAAREVAAQLLDEDCGDDLEEEEEQ